ncbi:hypothetical protein F4781DRAFT_445354 [Annulohypoxylon bovei var. microspora]|nr:hypothetical protein F4781DRAFT_445354 [Annulohypoxylon bovei var. microspora]
MPTSELRSAYRQYKADTNYVATWLASTAKANGCRFEYLNDQPNTSQGTGRPKGKARKQARQAPQQPCQTHVIAIKDFVPLAEYIATHQPFITVPESLAVSLRRAIKLRGDFGGDLQKHGCDLDVLADQAHEYFVSVLARVCNVLRPRMAFNTSSKDEEGGPSRYTTDFTNFFSRLSIGEPLECSMDEPDISNSDSLNKPSSRSQYVAEPQSSREDALFALYQVLGDVSNIRDDIIQTWSQVFIESSEYSVYPLTCAALLTSLGIELVRDLVEDITQVCEKHGGVLQLLQAMCVAAATKSGLSEEQIWEPGTDDARKFNPKYMYRFQEKVFLTPLYFLSRCNEQQTLIRLNIDIEQMFPLETYSGNTKELVDSLLLQWYYGESHLLASKWGSVAEDEVIKGMHELTELPSKMIHLSFAGQVFLDIHHHYKENVTKAFDTMIQQMIHIKNELEDYRKFQDRHPTNKPRLNESRRENLERISTSLDGIISDASFDTRVDICNGLGVPKPRRRHGFLRRNPVLCGHILLHFQSEYQQYEFSMLNSDPVLITASHICNALYTEKLLGEPWSDLVFLTRIMPKSAFFVGEHPPSGLDNCYRRLLLQLGFPASTFASNRQYPPSGNATLKQREIPRTAELLCIFSEKYKFMKKTESANWTREFIETSLKKSDFKELFNENRGNARAVQHMTTKEIRERNRALQDPKRRARSVRTHMSLEDLLEGLRTSLVAETTCFTFPFLTMLRMAWECLEHVKRACDPLIEVCYPNYSRQSSQIDQFATYLLAASAKEAASNVGQKPKVLQVAAAAVSEFIHSGSANEAYRRLHEATGMVFKKDGDDKFITYISPPRPTEEEVEKWRELTQTKELFSEKPSGDDIQ